MWSDGLAVVLWWFKELYSLSRSLAPTNGQTDKGVPRGPRGPKKCLTRGTNYGREGHWIQKVSWNRKNEKWEWEMTKKCLTRGTEQAFRCLDVHCMPSTYLSWQSHTDLKAFSTLYPILKWSQKVEHVIVQNVSTRYIWSSESSLNFAFV